MHIDLWYMNLYVLIITIKTTGDSYVSEFGNASTLNKLLCQNAMFKLFHYFTKVSINHFKVLILISYTFDY